MAERPWRVLLTAKGIQQVVKVPSLGARLETCHQVKPDGAMVRNSFRIIRVDEHVRYAEAVFERSRVMSRRRQAGRS